MSYQRVSWEGRGSGVGFGFGARSDFTQLPQALANPGPGHYDHSLLKRNVYSVMESTNSIDIKRYSRNVELPRYESPGPGYYSLVTSSTKRLSIPRGKRWLSEVRVDYEAKPTSYVL